MKLLGYLTIEANKCHKRVLFMNWCGQIDRVTTDVKHFFHVLMDWPLWDNKVDDIDADIVK